MIIEKISAIANLVPNANFEIIGDTIISHRGKTVPSEAEIQTEMSRLEKEYSDNEYARKRASAYDSVGNQLDMLMKDMRDGTITHQESCEAVKTRFPKPE